MSDLCRSCRGGCCIAGTNMPLDSSEVAFMERSATQLEEILPARPGVRCADAEKELANHRNLSPKMAFIANRLGPGLGLYTLLSPCGNLVEEDGWLKCAAYENPERPAVCKIFPVGSADCRDIRKKRGVDNP